MGYGGNVVARNVTCDNGHGIAIGSVSHGTVANVTVEDIRFFDSRNGLCGHTPTTQASCPVSPSATYS